MFSNDVDPLDESTFKNNIFLKNLFKDDPTEKGNFSDVETSTKKRDILGILKKEKKDLRESFKNLDFIESEQQEGEVE